MTAKREFNSFRDLGGPKQEPKSKGERGWKIERDDGDGAELDDDELDDLDLDDGTHARIDARPDAFDAMEHGPPAYRDLESDEMELLASFRVRTVFPADVLAEVAGLPADPRSADTKGRLDLRGETIFTIDGEDAQDFDDAISIERTPGGNLAVGVHIADVGHYVRPGTTLDDEALARGTSVYLPDQVVPMLPEGLSNGLCSLVPARDRLAYSVHMEFDDAGARVGAEVQKSVIRSVRRCTYREVQALLDGEDGLDADLRALEAPLRLFERWTRKQQELRDKRGSMRIQSFDRKFVFDGEGEVEAIVEGERYFSNTLIEETALAANQAVGDLFHRRGLPTIYRVHPEKDPEEVERVAQALAKVGIRVPKKQRLTGRDVGRLIRLARNRPNSEGLIRRIMGLVERAFYEVRDREDVAEHFGLAREAYLHFTSPIRRYPDLVVHRWLHAVETDPERAAEELSGDALVADMNQTAQHCSLRAEIAEMAEMAIGDLKVCQLVEPRIGERFDAIVTHVSPAGMAVRLTELNVEGFLPAKRLGDRTRVEGTTITVRRGRRQLSFTEGHPTRVKVEDVDFLRLQVLLELA